jgi:hypothetical protein
VVELQHVRCLARHVLQVLVSTLADRVPEQYVSLPGIDKVFRQWITVE